MNYAEIKHFDIANGEGVRTTLFVSGCRRGCKNCFNEVAWNFAAGKPFTAEVADEIIGSLRPDYVDGLTLLGGEPMEPENQEGLVEFVERVRKEFPRSCGKTIWCFTGDTWDRELVAGGRHHTEFTDRLLACIDVLVDGPFVQDLHDITLRFSRFVQPAHHRHARHARRACCGGGPRGRCASVEGRRGVRQRIRCRRGRRGRDGPRGGHGIAAVGGV